MARCPCGEGAWAHAPDVHPHHHEKQAELANQATVLDRNELPVHHGERQLCVRISKPGCKLRPYLYTATATGTIAA